MVVVAVVLVVVVVAFPFVEYNQSEKSVQRTLQNVQNSKRSHKRE